MRLVFNLDDVICTPAKGIRFGIVEYIKIINHIKKRDGE